MSDISDQTNEKDDKIKQLRSALHALHALIAGDLTDIDSPTVSLEQLNAILISEGLDAISLSSIVSEIDYYKSLGVAICDCEAAPNHALGWVATVAADGTDTAKAAGGDDE